MKINDTSRIGAVNPYQRTNEAQRTQETKKPEARKDEVTISPEAMQMLQAANKTTDTDRTARIQELKQQVASGTYSVDANKIAEKLLPFLSE
ncbi:flagellar biosynthesis anti-sigma factor FlgM [Saccharibacillus sp. CPCC 101409]|uniref:flagellar biosynthesis anti-sigma factor FlgM n=1 Tax=Saccharibacillus sp. CPCC 101409 TaxID=3058041 RepID=UPI0026725322|nr:flagellar biosynthesis anti-sigma factor FlgM [Saccharibacillus sp. CPCC 101409]MDO3412086.1 flagellar biosynthesis anti-sigma factor FlgM [Saccharibacillus sp. CPCC 101409]